MKQQQAQTKSDHVQVGITIKNISGYFINSAFVDCTALGISGDIVEISSIVFENLKINETAYNFAIFLQINTKVIYSCRVRSVSLIAE